MHITTGQIIAGLIAAVALCLAFMAAGSGMVALLLAAIGSAAVGWLIWSLFRRLVARESDRPA